MSDRPEESREATHAWIKEWVHDNGYAHGLADDVFDLLEQNAALVAERDANYAQWMAAHEEWMAAEAERDRYKAALEQIVDRGDAGVARGIARAVLSVSGQRCVRCAYCGLDPCSCNKTGDEDDDRDPLDDAWVLHDEGVK